MTEDLSGIAALVAAVEAGSFAAAAERLHLTRSAVAKSVARIEARLGVRLFHRTTRRLSLTEDGQAYYERCARALEELRTGAAVLESGRHEVAGRLRVTMPVLFGRCCVMPILARLAAEHPRLELDLGFSDRTVDLVEDGFDLAVRNGAIGDGTGLMARRVGTHTMSIVGAPSYLAAHGQPRTLDDLAAHRAILYGRTGRTLGWRFPVAGAAPVVVTPPSRLRFDDLESIADAAVAGHGLAWLPCWLIRERVRAGALACVLSEIPSISFESHALWVQTPHLPLRLRLAIDALAAGLPARIAL